MLRIVQNKNSASAQSYYSKADYYTEGQELTGRWGGRGAKLLGLEDEVQQEAFNRLCENRHPQTGERLTARTDSDRTVGYDFNFHCPKGVSVLYALNQDERILQAFRTSVEETMQELEREAKTRVRKGKRNEERDTGNLCWSEFIHFTARPVDGVPDPHLHAHCFVQNITFDPQEKRWKAAQFRDHKANASYFEAAFHARFAKSLNEIGYATQRQGKHWDLAGMPEGLTDKFSRRKKLIERMAEEKGITDAEKKGELGAKTREKKQQELSMPELRRLWCERLSQADDAWLNDPPSSTSSAPVSDRQAIEFAIQHRFERHSVVPERDLLTEALRYGVGEASVEGVQQELGKQNVLSGVYRGRKLVTTKDVLEEERAMLEFARRGRKAATPLNPAWRIQRDWLNAGQRTAVRHVLESADRVMVILGKAGTGKTTLMQEAVAGIEATGKRVFTFAPSAEASRNVLRSEGFENATTVAELLVNSQLQQETNGQVLWIDEAGLIGTRTLKKVFDLAARNECRVILSGDWRQHGSVERGAAMRLLEQEAGLQPALVHENKRQQPADYRGVVDLVSEGRLADGLERLDQLGWIREAEDTERNQLIAQEYADCIAKRESVLAISPTNAEVERVNAAIRHELKTRGLLDSTDHEALRLLPRHLTEAERADPTSYTQGDVLIFHQNAAGFRKGERVSLIEPLSADIAKLAKHFQVYRASKIPIARHETIRITGNGRTKDGKHRLNNGSTYQVREILPSGDLKLANGWIVDARYGLLAAAYCSTSHAVQGRTTSTVLLAEPSHSLGAASREQLYVSLSRGRQKIHLYTDDKQALLEAVHRSEDRLSATELLTHSKNEAELRRLQLARARIIAAREATQPSRTWGAVYGR